MTISAGVGTRDHATPEDVVMAAAAIHPYEYGTLMFIGIGKRVEIRRWAQYEYDRRLTSATKSDSPVTDVRLRPERERCI